MPGSRARALEHIAGVLESASRHDEAALRQLLAVKQLLGGCRSVARTLVRFERYEPALDWSRRCHDRGVERDAFAGLGRFDEAASAIVSSGSDDGLDLDGMILVLAGHWAEAAVRADAVARWLEQTGYPGADPDRARDRESARTRYECIAALLRHRAGEPSARARLDALAAGQHADWCVVARALSLSGDARRDALRAGRDRWTSPDDWRLRQLADGLLWAEGAPAADWRTGYRDVVRAIRGDAPDLIAWLAPWAHERWTRPSDGAEPRQAALALARLALVEVVRGELGAARDLASRADARAAEVDGEPEVGLLAPYVELRAGTPALAGDTQAPDLGLLRPGIGSSGDLHGLVVEPRSCVPEANLALQSAQRGDGAPLAAVMQRCHVAWAPSMVLAVLPHMTAGRDVLAAALAQWSSEHARDVSFPFSTAAYAAMRRDLLRLAGREAEAERWHGIARRISTALRERDRLDVLLLWSR